MTVRLIEALSDSLLATFKHDESLVDAYDVYDCLMNYWSETMQDDCYLIAANGWKAKLYTPQPTAKKKDAKPKEKKASTPEDVACDLLPVSIVVDEYFAKEKRLISASEELLNDKENQLNELLEEHAEDAFDEDNFTDNKLSDGNIKKRIKSLDKKSDSDEIAVLTQYLELKAVISQVKRELKTLKENLLAVLKVKYSDLTEDDIKWLVIEKKWFAALSTRLDSEMQRIGQQLTSKVSALAERYAQTLPEIDAAIADLEAKVAEHLKQMGF